METLPISAQASWISRSYMCFQSLLFYQAQSLQARVGLDRAHTKGSLGVRSIVYDEGGRRGGEWMASTSTRCSSTGSSLRLEHFAGLSAHPPSISCVHWRTLTDALSNEPVHTTPPSPPSSPDTSPTLSPRLPSFSLRLQLPLLLPPVKTSFNTKGKPHRQ